MNELAEVAEGRVRKGEDGRGAVVLVADDVLLQVSSEAIRQEVLEVATWWKGWRDAKWSLDKCSYLKLPRGRRNGVVYLDGEVLKVRETGRYLGMTLGAERLMVDHKRTRMRGAETQALVSCGWGNLNLRPCQGGLAFNALVQ